jgi:hypothetical protein
MNLLTFVILALGVWRLSFLLANEGGPKGIFRILRFWAWKHSPRYANDEPKPGSFADGLFCEWCNSVWIGTLTTIAFLALRNVQIYDMSIVVWIYLPLAMSTVTIMLKYFREKMEK